MRPHVAVGVFFGGQGQSAVKRQDDLGQVANAELAAHGAAGQFDLIVANVLVEERLGLLVDEALARNHASGLAKVTGNPTAALFFCNSGCCAGAAEKVCD
jgi:hypothetical protein